MTGGATAIPEVQALLRVLAAGRDVAEMGSAFGETAAMMAETARSVVTVELDPDRAAAARDRLRDLPNVEALEGDVWEELCGRGPFDLVFVDGGLRPRRSSPSSSARPLHTRPVRIVDLSHTYSDDMPLYPGLPSPSFHDFAEVERDGYAMSEYHLLNHIGTHVDAPAHQIAGGATLDEIPLESLVTEAVTVDLSGREAGAIGRSELEPLLGDLGEGDWLFLCSDNGRNWGSDDYWTGWSYPDADASRALVERGIVGIGFDGPSADPVDTETFSLHKVWLGAGRMILENLTNLDLLPARTQVVVAPLKVRAANGAPARVLAFVPD